MPARSIRSALVLACSVALGAGVLAAAPASAAPAGLSFGSSTVAVDVDGYASIPVKCDSKSTCKGSLYVDGTKYVSTSYSVAGRTSKWVTVRLSKMQEAYPHDGGGTGTLGARPATLVAKESSPNNRTTERPVTVEKRITQQRITGTVSGVGPAPEKTKVALWGSNVGRGTPASAPATVDAEGRYSITVALGKNNSNSSTYRLEVTGTVDGEFRSWWWRGSNDVALGGGRYHREASLVSVPKTGYVADVRYGAITGTVSRRGATIPAEITVAAPPTSFGSTRDKRALDLESCANVWGTDTSSSSGRYTVGFLPIDTTKTDTRYMVLAEDGENGTANLWNDEFGSCLDATGYGGYRSKLIALTTSQPSKPQNFDLRPATGRIAIDGSYRAAPTTADKRVNLRAYVPGRKILDSKIVTTGLATSGAADTLNGVAPGRYWVEIGRRTSCSSWMQSRYKDNYLYHKGVDRLSERWKTVNDKWAEYQKSYDMGYVAKKPSKGYKGWMFRDHCTSAGAGSYKLVDVDSDPVTETPETVTWQPSISRGAKVSGKVTRTGGRSNKEIMVTVYSTDGIRVLRTAITNGSGNFTVYGLATGSYKISVNSDSWRGIARSFSGTKSKKVTAGGSYSVGTLRLKG